MTKVKIVYKKSAGKEHEILDCSYAKIQGGVLVLAFTPKASGVEEVKFRYIPFDIIEEASSTSFVKLTDKFDVHGSRDHREERD